MGTRLMAKVATFNYQTTTEKVHSLGQNIIIKPEPYNPNIQLVQNATGTLGGEVC